MRGAGRADMGVFSGGCSLDLSRGGRLPSPHGSVRQISSTSQEENQPRGWGRGC